MADLNAVKVNNLSKSFGNYTVLDDISLSVSEGENLVVFGRSGTGKSVLLKCIIGLMKHDKGEIFVKGMDISELTLKELNELRKRMGFLFQGGALYDSMTVRENMAFPLIRRFKYAKSELNDKIMYTLELVGLAEAVDKMPSELSGGMRKRIALARSIITDPEIMLYDEPTTGLDPLTSKEISVLIRELQTKFKMTSIVVTHDLVCANIIADKAIFLRDGKIKYSGTIDELMNSQDLFLRNFFSYELITS